MISLVNAGEMVLRQGLTMKQLDRAIESGEIRVRRDASGRGFVDEKELRAWIRRMKRRPRVPSPMFEPPKPAAADEFELG